MEEGQFQRFNSHATGRFLNSDNSTVSPVLSVAPLERSSSLQSPIIQTPDHKQWIDLDILHPKLLKELRRQYEPSLKDEFNGPIAKGAARVKAWARQSKLGVDIRLRRKVTAEHDEVTELHLVPERQLERPYYRDDKAPWVSELPDTQKQITELADSSTPLELDAVRSSPLPVELGVPHRPARRSTDESIGEPLPRYEPRRPAGEDVSPPESDDSSQGRIEPVQYRSESFHRPSSSQDSIVATPTGGLSSHDFDSSSLPDGSQTQQTEKGVLEDAQARKSGSGPDSKAPGRYLEAKQLSPVDSTLSDSLRALIEAVKQEQLEKQGKAVESEDRELVPTSNAMSGNLKLAKKTVYETETDAEPLSPSQRRATKASKKKYAAGPKRMKSALKTKSSPSASTKRLEGSDDDAEPKTSLLTRKQTLPTRLRPGADAEEVWSSLLRIQAKILGPEHPLVYQAKSDMAKSRAFAHVRASEELLASLQESECLAIGILGIVHPFVMAFAEQLKSLKILVGIEKKGDCGPASTDAAAFRTYRLGMDQSPRNVDEHDKYLPSDDGRTELETGAAVSSRSFESRDELPKITTSFESMQQTPASAPTSPAQRQWSDDLWSTRQPPHKPRSGSSVLASLAIDSGAKSLLGGIQWLRDNYGPEQPVESGKVRVRWTCSCGQQLHDDFTERRLGAARELEAYLNRPRMHTGSGQTPTSPSSSYGSRSFASSSIGGLPSQHSSWSSYNYAQGSMGSNGDTKPPRTYSGLSPQNQYSPFPEPPWLLTCTNEGRHTPKLSHLDMAPHKISSDKQLALSLRQHYFHVNNKWWHSLRLRGLTTIEFVQLEVHQNRFADIRKCPDMPALGTADYDFQPSDLLPPVGSHYLLHLFKHPEDYDGELITYLRAPKRNGRLHIGVGFGINLVEGFLADRVWMSVSAIFALSSLIFVIAWICKKGDVQGASGIATWMTSFVVLVVGWMQAFLG